MDDPSIVSYKEKRISPHIKEFTITRADGATWRGLSVLRMTGPFFSEWSYSDGAEERIKEWLSAKPPHNTRL